MDISQIELSSDERRLFVEFSDSGMPLSLMLSEVRSYYPKLTEDQQLKVAKEILLSLIDKGLIALCKLTTENIINNVYEVNEITTMSFLEVENHISNPINWKQYTDSIDDSIQYDIAPTDKGERLLDLIFDFKP